MPKRKLKKIELREGVQLRDGVQLRQRALKDGVELKEIKERSPRKMRRYFKGFTRIT